MDRDKIKNHLFQRIGNAYAHLIDADHFLGRTALEGEGLAKPPFNMRRLENGYEFNFSLHGFQKEEILVQLTDCQLKVKATHKKRSGAKEENAGQVDFLPGTVERTILLPENADEEQVQAAFINGLLTIRVPFKEDRKAGRTKFIPII